MQTALILLHGALGSAAQFDDLLPLLPAGRPIRTLNLPGHGGLPAGEPYSMDAFAEATRVFLEKEDLQQADLFGYSMGGYAALTFARKYPARVRKIATLGTKFDWTPETAQRETALLDPEKIAAKVPQFAAALADRHAPEDWKTVLRRTADLLHALGNGAALTSADLAAVECPALILRGELDHLVTEAESGRAAEAIPQGRFETLGGVKHPFEQVDKTLLADRLQSFFTD